MKSGLRFIKKISLGLIIASTIACGSQQKSISEIEKPNTTIFLGKDGEISYKCEQTVNQHLDWIDCTFVSNTLDITNSCWGIDYFNPYKGYYAVKTKSCFQLSDTKQSVEKYFAVRNDELRKVTELCGDNLEKCVLEATATYYVSP